MSDLLTLAQIADRTGLSYEKVKRRLVDTPPAAQAGRSKLYPASVIDELVCDKCGRAL